MFWGRPLARESSDSMDGRINWLLCLVRRAETIGGGKTTIPPLVVDDALVETVAAALAVDFVAIILVLCFPRSAVVTFDGVLISLGQWIASSFIWYKRRK